MNGPDDHLMMLGVIAGFNIRLRIYAKVRRPIHEPNGKKIRLFRQQSDLCPQDPLVWLESAKHRYLSPFRQAQFGLQFIRVRDALVLNLQT